LYAGVTIEQPLPRQSCRQSTPALARVAAPKRNHVTQTLGICFDIKKAGKKTGLRQKPKQKSEEKRKQKLLPANSITPSVRNPRRIYFAARCGNCWTTLGKFGSIGESCQRTGARSRMGRRLTD
jgi:hypothetical protein